MARALRAIQRAHHAYAATDHSPRPPAQDATWRRPRRAGRAHRDRSHCPTHPVTGSQHAGTANAAIHRVQPRAHTFAAVIPAGFGGFFRDPATHALHRVLTTTRNGSPTLASVLAP